MSRYLLFIQCKNLGIKFTPHDLDVPTLEALHTIYTKVDEIHEKKRK